MNLVPKPESEEPPSDDPADFGSLTLSRILGLDIPQSRSSSDPQFHAPPEVQAEAHQPQDLPPTHPHIPPPPPMAPSHQGGLSASRFFPLEGFFPVGRQGQPVRTPGISSQSNHHVDIDQNPSLGFDVNRLDQRSPLLVTIPLPLLPSGPTSSSNQKVFKPDKNHQLGATQHTQFDVNRCDLVHPDLMALPPGPSSATSTSSQPYIAPGFHASGVVAGDQMHLPGSSPSPSLQSRLPSRRTSSAEPLHFPLPGPSSAAGPTTSFNAWQQQNILPQNSLISQVDTAQPSFNCYQQTGPNYLMDQLPTNLPTYLPQQRHEPRMMEGIKPNQRPSVIQSRRKSLKSSIDDLKVLAPTAINVNHSTDIESQMTMRFIQEKYNSKKSRVLEQEAERSSVIVSSPKPALLDFEGIRCEEIDTELPEVNLDEINAKEYPDLRALCMTYLMEDAPNMKETEKSFYQAWYKINIGEQVLGSFIQFLKTQGPLPTTFMLMSGLQYR